MHEKKSVGSSYGVENTGINQRQTCRIKVRIPLDPAVLRQHRRVSHWKSPVLIAALFLTAVGLLVLGGRASGWLLAPVSFVLIAGLQSHLAILLHEGAHYLLHPNRKVNDMLADLCGMPLLTTCRNYRAYHLAHHEHCGDLQKDPERLTYAAMGYHYRPHNRFRDFAKMLAQDLLGVSAVRFLLAMNRYLKTDPERPLLTARDVWRLIAFVCAPLSLAAAFGLFAEVLLLWCLPLFTLSFLLLKLHGMGEHTGETGPTEFQRSWHHQPHPVVDFFIYPIRSGFHVAHHLYPNVPWYNMKSFHNQLMQVKEWEAQQEPLNSDGFFVGRNPIFQRMIYGSATRKDSKDVNGSGA